jgi:hypothetical protein
MFMELVNEAGEIAAMAVNPEVLLKRPGCTGLEIIL